MIRAKKMNSRPHKDLMKSEILDAARKVLAQHGCAGATISLIAAEAGVSRGLLHYYFKSKEDILAQVIKENTKIDTAMITEVFQQYRTPEGYAAGMSGFLKDMLNNYTDFLNIYVDGFAWARHSPIISSEMTDAYVNWKQAFEIGLKQAQEEQTITPRLPVKAVAALISALLDGILLQLISEPELVKDDLVMGGLEACIADLLGGRQ